SSDATRTELAGPLPDGARVEQGVGDATVALVFAPDAETLTTVLEAHGASLPQVATTWVLYPKGNATDLHRDTLWPYLTPYGLRPVGQVAVDDAWSALRFRALRDGEAPFNPGRT